MKTRNYIVTGKEGANLRVLPSSLSEKLGHLEHGETVQVVEDFSAVNTVGEKTTYLCVEKDGKFLWTVAGNLTVKKDKTAPTASTPAPKSTGEKATPAPAAPTPITTKKVNYLTRAADAAKKVYPLSIGKVHSGSDAGKVVSLSSLKKHHSLSCNRMMSITLQEAGLLEKGQIVSHTKKAKGKKTIADAVKNVKALKHCKVIWVNKRYKDLPAEYKKAGVAYIQNSNACMSAGNGKIYSCNKSDGEKYRTKGDYLRTGGYPFDSPILCVIVPDY